MRVEFDHHRMTALAHLKALVANPEHKEAAEEFLKSPPVPAHEVEAELSKALFWLRHAKPLLYSGGFNLAADDIGNFLSGLE